MNHEVAAFTAVVRQHLARYLDQSGATLYSAPHTLRPGPVYLLGTNPGGSTDDKDTLAASLAALPAKTENSYKCEVWDSRPGKPGQAPLQRRVDALLSKGLGLRTEDVCAANLVFQRTSRIAGLDFWTAAQDCWPVHEHVLGVVRPRLVVAFGNSATSAFAFLAKKLRPAAAPLDRIHAGHGSWECRGFRTTWHGRELYVAGLPHLSYYSPMDASGQIKPHVAQWLQAALGSDLAKAA